MATTTKLIPIYTSRGEVKAFLAYPYLYNPSGEWIGWVNPDRRVYSVHGHYVGEMSAEPRILRKREATHSQPRMNPIPAPPRIRPPLTVPLAPLMREVPQNLIDILDEAPELLPSVGHGELQDDLD
jgi:hypothetical protein